MILDNEYMGETLPVELSSFNAVVTAQNKDAGSWQIPWDGKDKNGKACATGLYYVQ